MTDSAAMTYLLALSDALAGESSQVRGDIIAGVREELEGLDAEQTAAKIAELGTPAFIAASAREEQQPLRVEPIVEAPVVGAPLPTAEPRWVSLLAAVLVMVGGLVVPFVGWIVGIVIVWISKAWTRRQKLLVTILPPAFAVLLLGIASFVAMWGDGVGENGWNTPLVPALFDSIWTGVFAPIPVAFGTGLWLLVTAKKD